MALPTATDVREYLEGNSIDSSVISDQWIEQRRDRQVIPWLEDYIEISFSGNIPITEFYSGNGTRVLILDRKGPLPNLRVTFPHFDNDTAGATSSFTHNERLGELMRPIIRSGIGNQGTLQNWPKGSKNIKVQYDLGFAPSDDLLALAPDLFELIVLLLAGRVLKQVRSQDDRSGGGSLSVEGYSKSKGGPIFQNTVNSIASESRAIIMKFLTGIVGD